MPATRATIHHNSQRKSREHNAPGPSAYAYTQTRRKYEKATAPCRGPCADYRSRSRACNLKYCAFVCRAPPQLSVALNAFRSRQWKQTCHFRHGQGERHPHGYSTSFRASLVCCPEIFLNIIHHRQRPFCYGQQYGLSAITTIFPAWGIWSLAWWEMLFPARNFKLAEHAAKRTKPNG